MYKHVLAATDFSQLGDRALARGVAIARAFDARLTVVHVLPNRDTTLYTHTDVGEHVDEALAANAAAEKALDERLATLDPGRTTDVTLEMRTGEPAEAILALAERCEADVVIVGTSGNRGMKRWLLGSNAELVVRGSERDVIVVGRAIED